MNGDVAFEGSIPEVYDLLLVPLIFEPYAADLAHRIAALAPEHLLETGAGTGALTRALALALPADTELVATDLNPPMIARAAAIGASRPVQWRQADAQQLPFADERFDLVACQFGAMFFPDKVRAFREALRVLKPGGSWLFNVWDRIEENVFAQVVTAALEPLYPGSPPDFMARLPHGYFDRATIAADLAAAGFGGAVSWDTVTASSTAPSAACVAKAYCQGTPLRNEIEARAGAGGPGLAEATRASEAAIAARFGAGPIEGKIQAHVIAVRK